MMEIGKLNIALIILVGVILVSLIAKVYKDDGGPNVYTQAARIASDTPVEPVTEVVATEADAISPAVTMTEQAEPAKPAPKVPGKKQKQHSVEPRVAAAEVVAPDPMAAEVQASPAPPVEQAPQSESARSMIVFNIWSVSELRLRAAYTKLMNDSSVPTAQADARKKDYLNFVNRRGRKCGELDNRFASNINTVEKLTFHERDIGILKCHTSENISELDRLIISHGFDS